MYLKDDLDFWRDRPFDKAGVYIYRCHYDGRQWSSLASERESLESRRLIVWPDVQRSFLGDWGIVAPDGPHSASISQRSERP